MIVKLEEPNTLRSNSKATAKKKSPSPTRSLRSTPPAKKRFQNLQIRRILSERKKHADNRKSPPVKTITPEQTKPPVTEHRLIPDFSNSLIPQCFKDNGMITPPQEGCDIPQRPVNPDLPTVDQCVVMSIRDSRARAEDDCSHDQRLIHKCMQLYPKYSEFEPVAANIQDYPVVLHVPSILLARVREHINIGAIDICFTDTPEPISTRWLTPYCREKKVASVRSVGNGTMAVDQVITCDATQGKTCVFSGIRSHASLSYHVQWREHDVISHVITAYDTEAHRNVLVAVNFASILRDFKNKEHRIGRVYIAHTPKVE